MLVLIQYFDSSSELPFLCAFKDDADAMLPLMVSTIRFGRIEMQAQNG